MTSVRTPPPLPSRRRRNFSQTRGVEVVEHTGSTADEVMLAAQAMVADGVDAVFTPTDNSIMKAELAIYETPRKGRHPSLRRR